MAVVDYHMELLSTDLEVLKAKIPALKGNKDGKEKQRDSGDRP